MRILLIPFFNKISTLQQFFEEIIEKKTNSELGDIIPREPVLQKLIVLKLINSNKYLDHKNWMLGVLKKINDTSRVQFYLAVMKFLDSGEYLKIDENTVIEKKEIVEPEQTEAKPVSLSTIDKSLQEKFLSNKEALARLGIFFNNTFTLHHFRDDINWKEWSLDAKEGNDFLYYLLLFAGTSVLKPTTNTYEPVSQQVYNFNSEWDGAVDHGEIIDRLNLLTGNSLPFEKVEGRFDDFIGVTFTYKGEAVTWEFKYDNDWTDYEVFTKFLALVKDDITKTFYILIEGQGGLIFYFDDAGKQKFEETFPGKELITLREFVE